MPEPQRVRVERELCLGAEYCTRIAPATFALDGEGLAFVADPAGDGDGLLEQAAGTCPAGAIFLAGDD